jgi:hypothetical protein
MPLVILVSVMTLVFVGGGIYILLVQHNGEHARAEVTDCEVRRIRQTTQVCYGRWEHDGHITFGIIDGANKAKMGKTIDVRLSGGRAYTTSLRLPIILLTIGVLFAAGGAYSVIKEQP